MTTQAMTAMSYMPVMGIEDAVDRRDAIVLFTRKVMKPGIDFGAVPGTDKPTLLKPGAEKLCTLFGLTPRFEIVESTTDWSGKTHGETFFYFHYRCMMYRGDALIATGEGSCNSMEGKYRYRWVNEADVPAHLDKATLKTRGGKISEFTFAIEKAETGGRYGKPAAYWQQFQDAIEAKTAKIIKKKVKDGREFDAWEIDSTLYRVPNPDVADQVNTIQKMAQKRALIAATLIAVNASEFYTQDMEDFAIDPDGAYVGSFVVRSTESHVERDTTTADMVAMHTGTPPAPTITPTDARNFGMRMPPAQTERMKTSQAVTPEARADATAEVVEPARVAGWKAEMIALGKRAGELMATAPAEQAALLSSAQALARETLRKNGDATGEEIALAMNTLNNAIEAAEMASIA